LLTLAAVAAMVCFVNIRKRAKDECEKSRREKQADKYKTQAKEVKSLSRIIHTLQKAYSFDQKENTGMTYMFTSDVQDQHSTAILSLVTKRATVE